MGNTQKYAVIGNPARHSLSPKIHRLFAEQAGIQIDYQVLEPEPALFANEIYAFQTTGGCGLNVTLPFKSEAFKLCDKLSDNAKLAQAVSCIAFQEKNSIFGDNYDGVGLIQDLSNNLSCSLQQKKILIIGSGGAVRGIVGPLLQKAPYEMIIANRTADKAVELAEYFQPIGPVQGVSLTEIPETSFDLVIHATSLGYSGNLPHLPDYIINQSTVCYDLSYGKAALPFLKFAEDHSAALTSDGLGMLVEHNAAAFYLWQGVYPETQAILKMLRDE